MTQFKTIDQFKSRAEFFPKGRIIPQRIFKAPRKLKHLLVFGGDAWALPTPNGYVITIDSEGGGCAILVKQPKGSIRAKLPSYTVQGSPYTSLGITTLIGNNLGDEAQLDELNKAINSAALARKDGAE